MSGATIGDPHWQPAPRGWYAALLAGSLPALVLGMVASALADRLAFAGWAVVAGLGHALLLRGAWQRGFSVPARAAWACGWGALALAVFAALVRTHGEILDLGYRALLWPVYAPALTRPATWLVLAGTLAVVASLAAWRARTVGRAAVAAAEEGVAP